MLLIYVDKLTNRLGYTLNLVFKELMSIKYSITIDKEYFMQYDGPKLSYTTKPIADELFLVSSSLLFQTIIEIVDINYFEKNNTPYIFKSYSKESICDFDVLAACFYLVSRYEEYLPYVKDKHSRFKAEDSLAYKKGFLKRPIVNIWVNELKTKIQNRYPELFLQNNKYSYINTIDIDSAYSYTCKGFTRNLLGFFRDLLKGDLSLCFERLRVLSKIQQDPYDTFDFIISLSEKYHTELLFFILFADYDNYDKNISHNSLNFQQLIKHLADYSKVGIHPSYASMDQPNKLTVEIKRLSKVLHKPIVRSRFHFLRFQLPMSYNNLIKNNIDSDFSMGYSNEYGFRASVCTPFNFYDLETDAETNLVIHPFAVMDTALKMYLNYTTDEALNILKNIIDEIKSVDGTFYSIWHNNNLCESFGWEGWSKVYEQMIDYVYKQN